MSSLKLKLVLTSSVFSFCFSTPLLAQGAVSGGGVNQDQGVGDIVVTAEKRSTSLQRTAIAITAFDAETLAETQTRRIDDLVGRVPNLQIGDLGGVPQIAIRGIGSAPIGPGSESPVAVHFNGVYGSRPNAAVSSFFDLSSVEILRGPQGTLYGRNATAGSLNITTARPTENDLSGYGRVTVGNHQTVNVEGAVGGAIIPDKLLFRIAGLSEYHAGYGKNLGTGNDIDDRKARAIRGTLVFNPTPELSATLIAEYFRRKDNSGGQHFFGSTANIGEVGQNAGRVPLFIERGGFSTTDIRDIAADDDPLNYAKLWSVIGDVRWQSGNLSIRSLTGYRGQKTRNIAELGGGVPSAGWVTFGEPADQFSEELTVGYESERFNITGGLYYFHEKLEGNPLFVVYQPYVFAPTQALRITTPAGDWIRFIASTGGLKTEAKAAFAQGSYEIVDNLKLTAGIRYSDESKDVHQEFAISTTDVVGPDYRNPILRPIPSVSRSASWDSWTPKFGIEYQVTPRTLVYATYSKGFRAGTFDLNSAPSVPALNPEEVEAYEGGIKTTLFDNRLRLNLAGFYLDYTNIVLTQSTGVIIQQVNGGEAEIYGLEVEMTALPTPNLRLEGNAAYTHSEFTSDYCTTDALRPLLPVTPMVCNGAVVNNATVNYKGQMLPNAPKWRLFGAVQYIFFMPNGELSLRGEANYTSNIYFQPNNILAAGQEAHAKFNAFLAYESKDRWRIGAYINNITDKVTRTSFAVSNTFGAIGKGGVSAPRTFGLEFGYRF